MKPKIIIGSCRGRVVHRFRSYSFTVESNVEYTDIAGAIGKAHEGAAQGSWNKAKEASFDARSSQFTFWLVTTAAGSAKSFLTVAAPNNFELATSVVAKEDLPTRAIFTRRRS